MGLHCPFALCTILGNCFQHNGNLAVFLVVTIYFCVKVDYIAHFGITLLGRNRDGIHIGRLGFRHRLIDVLNVKYFVIGTA